MIASDGEGAGIPSSSEKSKDNEIMVSLLNGSSYGNILGLEEEADDLVGVI